MAVETKKRKSAQKEKSQERAQRQSLTEDVTYTNPYLNQSTRRFETYVELGRDVAVMHKGVVYHVKYDADKETIILASNHRWRPGFLMVVISPRDITAEEAHKLINDYANSFIWCHTCLRDGVGHTSYRIDFDLKSRSGRVVCTYCDPTVDFTAGFFDSLERARSRGARVGDV
jgi:hypothetical protein